jgi:hypothetical protein
MANATLFYFLFHRLVLSQVHFTYGNFAWGLHGRRDVKWSVPEIIDPVFAKTSPKRSFSMTEYERFGLVFTKTRVFNSGTGGLLVLELH